MTIQNYNYDVLLTPVKLASAVNIPGIYNNGPINSGVDSFLNIPLSTFSIDLVEVEIGDSVLLTNQTNANENGIYVCVQTGGIYSFSILQRRNDFQSIEQIREGQLIPVSDGAINRGSIYSVIPPLPLVLGKDPILFVSSSQTYKVLSFDQTDLSKDTDFEVIPSIASLAVLSGTDFKFNNPINVVNNPIDNQIIGNLSAIELNGVIQGSINASASAVISKGSFQQNALSICHACAIDFISGELNQGTVIGQLVEILPIQTPTNISNLSPRVVQNNSGISLPRVDNISGAFDYLMTADNAANYYVAAGTSPGSAGDPTKCNANEVLKLNINGNDRFIPLFNSNS